MHARACFVFFSHKKWEYQTCGAGVVIKNVSSGSFIAVEDLQGVHLETSVEVVTGDFPTCWEMEVMDNGNAEGGDAAAALRDGPGLQGRLRRSTGTFRACSHTAHTY